MLIAASVYLLGGLANSATAATEVVLHSFGNNGDGTQPYAQLNFARRTLYGTTYEGGVDGSGTVFSITPKGKEKVLYAFPSNNVSGVTPEANLIDIKGTLYGTTLQGGEYGGGTVFSFNPKSDTETVLHSFGNGSDGYAPYAGLINIKGKLYGTTFNGGVYGSGTAFVCDLKTGTETVLHSFGNGSDGNSPYAGLVSLQGTLYGTTVFGGAYNLGTAFTLDPKSGAEAVLHSFGNGGDGLEPYAGLVAVKGTLYGTTDSGGAGNYGTVFSITPDGAEQVLYSFNGGDYGDGAEPDAGLINVKGTLYGTTSYGGSYGLGSVFSFNLDAGVEAVLHSFGNGSDGFEPYAGLTSFNGKLYGTTYNGGSYGGGTAFSVSLK